MAITTMPVWSLSLRVLTIFGLPSGIAVGLLTWNPVVGILAGSFSGAWMAAAMVWPYARKGLIVDSSVPGVRQECAFVVPGTSPELANVVEVALFERLHALSKRTEADHGITIRARTPVSWESWGEVIAVEIVPAAERCVEVRVASRPAVRSTLADYGRNLGNIVHLQEGISRWASTRGR